MEVRILGPPRARPAVLARPRRAPPRPRPWRRPASTSCRATASCAFTEARSPARSSPRTRLFARKNRSQFSRQGPDLLDQFRFELFAAQRLGRDRRLGLDRLVAAGRQASVSGWRTRRFVGMVHKIVALAERPTPPRTPPENGWVAPPPWAQGSYTFPRRLLREFRSRNADRQKTRPVSSTLFSLFPPLAEGARRGQGLRGTRKGLTFDRAQNNGSGRISGGT